MFKTMFSKGILPVAEAAASFAEQRHKVIANNIANIDTPYYKARDLAVDEFQKTLGEAIDRRNRENPRIWDMHSTRRVQVTPLGVLGQGLRASTRKTHDINVLAHDENKRSIETEMSNMAKNQALYRLMNSLAIHEYTALESAIRERP